MILEVTEVRRGGGRDLAGGVRPSKPERDGGGEAEIPFCVSLISLISLGSMLGESVGLGNDTDGCRNWFNDVDVSIRAWMLSTVAASADWSICSFCRAARICDNTAFWSAIAPALDQSNLTPICEMVILVAEVRQPLQASKIVLKSNWIVRQCEKLNSKHNSRGRRRVRIVGLLSSHGIRWYVGWDNVKQQKHVTSGSKQPQTTQVHCGYHWGTGRKPAIMRLREGLTGYG